MNCFNLLSPRFGGSGCKKMMDDCCGHDESFMRPAEYVEREKYVKETKVMTSWHKEPAECECRNMCR